MKLGTRLHRIDWPDGDRSFVWANWVGMSTVFVLSHENCTSAFALRVLTECRRPHWRVIHEGSKAP